MDVFIARQAILDRGQKLFAYELLFRPCQQGHASVTDDSAATLQVLATTLLSAGLHFLSESTPVFINFGKEMLTTGWASVFPSSVVVVEILESVTADAEVIAACVEMKRQGYRLALDDVTEEADSDLLQLADIIKVDFRATSLESQARLARDQKRAGKRLLAEKVETLEEFERAKGLGFDYFQGFFFSKPVLHQGHQVVAIKGNAMRILGELSAPEIDFRKLEAVIRCDVSLTYKLLRYVNSALFARTKAISAVHGALVAMGELDIRRWIVLATLLDTSGTSQVLATHALTRGRVCECLAVAAGSHTPSNAFLVGMFSLLDALAHRPLPDVLAELGLPLEIVSPLLGYDVSSNTALALALAKCYEAGDWDHVSELAKQLGVAKEVVAGNYMAAVEWASKMIDTAGGTAKSSGVDPATMQVEGGSDLRALDRAVMGKDNGKKGLLSGSEMVRSRK